MMKIRQKINYDCDVLISGGGPAGSALAYHLAKHGLKVIVAEAEVFPRDKVCGDAVSPIAIKELHEMGITQSSVFKNANEITKVGLFVEKDHAIVDLLLPEELPYHARVIRRFHLDHEIFKKAVTAGAAFLQNTRVLEYTVSEHKVVTILQENLKQNKTSITSKVIIGADGSRSVVRRALQAETFDNGFQLLGLRAYYDEVSGPLDRMDVYFIKENFPGIYWFFPDGKSGANIGLATLSKTFPHKPAQVKKLLTDHIAKNKDIKNRIGNGKLRDKIDGWPITFYDAKKKVAGHRVLLVGEAAGLINPLSGDGIQYALLSARWASEVLMKCMEEDDFSDERLAKYKQILDKELGYDLAFSNLIVHFPRNKSLLPVWMKAVDILVARAREDKKFAEIIVGISEGTFPSFKALTLDFVFKIILQGSKSATDFLVESIKHPAQFKTDGEDFVSGIKQIIEEISKESKENVHWVSQIAQKLLNVSRYAVKGNKM